MCMKMTKVVCFNCGKTFDKKSTEVRRTQKRNGKHYCSLSCSGANTPLIVDKKSFARSTSGLKSNNRLDEYSPFRSHHARLKQRRHEVTVTLQDLKRIWDEQNGICPLTGWEMDLPATSKWTGLLCKPDSASLDRIDSSQGYIVENVRWVSLMANLARRQWDDSTVIEFAKAVVGHSK